MTRNDRPQNWSLVIDHVPGQGWEAYFEGDQPTLGTGGFGWEADTPQALLASVADALRSREDKRVPVPVGTLVRYHGSVPHSQEEYEIEGYGDIGQRRDLSPEVIAAHWPGGIAYTLWPAGVPRKWGNREQAIYFVRRASFTVEGRRGRRGMDYPELTATAQRLLDALKTERADGAAEDMPEDLFAALAGLVTELQHWT